MEVTESCSSEGEQEKERAATQGSDTSEDGVVLDFLQRTASAQSSEDIDEPRCCGECSESNSNCLLRPQLHKTCDDSALISRTRAAPSIVKARHQFARPLQKAQAVKLG